MPKQQGSEFLYLDEHGNKQDADLHGPILGAVDYPVDEKIMLRFVTATGGADS